MQELPPPKPFYFFAKLKKAPFYLASIIKIPPKNPPAGPLTYLELPCAEIDKKIIAEIISTMAENGAISLALKSSHLKKLGAQIEHVHPLRFMGTIFSNGYLKTCMRPIFESSLKRKEFMKGLSDHLAIEADKGMLLPYLNEFAAEVNVPPETIEHFFHSRDWEQLVQFLMRH